MLESIVPFGKYKELGGEMNKETLDRVKEARYNTNQYTDSFKEMMGLGLGLFPHTDVVIYTKLSVVHPDKQSMWKITEMYLVQGKK